MKILREYFGKRMREALHEKRLSPKVLAERLNVTEATVSRWSTGKILPSDARLPQIIAAIGTEASFFEPVSLEEKEIELLRLYRESDDIAKRSILDTTRELWAGSTRGNVAKRKKI